MRSSTVPARVSQSPLTVAVALHQPISALLAVGRAGQATHLQLHQPLGRIADHLAQKIGVRALLHQRSQVHHVIGHLRSSLGLSLQTRTYRRSLMTAAPPLARYGAVSKGALREPLR